MSDDSDDAENEKAGYGRPPKKSQFKPGQSGNPRGRPKGSRSFGAILAEAMKSKVSVTKNGKTRLVPFMEGIVLRLCHDALRGDRAAIRDILTLSERYAAATEGAGRIEDLLTEDLEILARYTAETRPSQEKESTSRGSDEPSEATEKIHGEEGDVP